MDFDLQYGRAHDPASGRATQIRPVACLRNRATLVMLVLAASLTACATGAPQNQSGRAVVDVDPGIRGPVAGVGIEGQDVVAMTDRMVRDLLSTPTFSGGGLPPRVIVDGEYFINDSSQAINRNLITERLRADLNRSASGRMLFIGRSYAHMVELERDLKRQGVTDVGTAGMTRAQAGADYRLGGRIMSLDTRNSATGMIQRYTQILFEMVDLESGIIVWSGLYEFARAGADDVVYR